MQLEIDLLGQILKVEDRQEYCIKMDPVNNNYSLLWVTFNEE